MRRTTLQLIALFIALFLTLDAAGLVAYAAEFEDEAVSAVIAQLEAIDTLQEMQANRSGYTVKNNHYDSNTTSSAVIEEHENVRTQYETYVNMMFSARAAAQQAYDALTPAQQSQIDPSLVAKLSNDLPTVLNINTYAVTPRSDEYTFEAVRGETGYGYEVSNHMVSGNIPQTFILVDTSNGETTWTPNGKYVYGKSNYDVAYCCDIETTLAYGSDYRRINLEDSGYYGADAAQHIRAILQNSYPFITMDEMKARLKAAGLDSVFVDSLTRSDVISAVQMAVWTYSNANDGAQDGLGYFASIDISANTGIYFTPLHDHSNECWDWLPGKRQRSYDARAAYRVNNLAYYLCSLEGVAPSDNQIIISDVKITRADLIHDSDGTYDVGMYVYLNNSGNEQDDLTVTVTSYSTNDDGTTSTTARTAQFVGGQSKLEMSVKAKSGDTIKVVVEGTQTLEKGVYFYEPEGGRGISQCLVGVAEGQTNVRAEEAFEFTETVGEMGLRIYKTETGTGYPLSEITFDVYKVVPGEEDILSEIPTEEEIAKYATQENLVGSVTTDTNGYAEIALENGTYLIVEEHNTEKIKEPVKPFYVAVPMFTTEENEDGTTSVKTVNIVSVYPKNEPIKPPEEPPVIPPTPDSVKGSFEILKYDQTDKSVTLQGAEFAVYHTATDVDTDTQTLVCDGVQYVVVPVMVDGEQLVLKTNEVGRALSPELECGVYFLQEIKAPYGYNLQEEAIPVTVLSNVMTSTVLIEIANERGNLLPETGGVGTTMFWIIGSIMTVSAAILLITKKRMSLYE